LQICSDEKKAEPLNSSQLAMPYLSALVTGTISGISQCSVACAPFVSTYVMGSGEGALDGIKSYSAFSAGKLIMYAILGLFSGHIGAMLDDANDILPGVSMVFSFILVSIGVMMLIRPVRANCQHRKGKTEQSDSGSRRLMFNPRTHAFFMGTAFAAVPCPPMAGMLVYSLKMPSILSSSVLMALFGLGTAFSPLIVICAAAGWFSKNIKTKAPQYKMMFQRISGIILIFLGLLTG
jgi:cytochrome c-type biogenesis protein